MTDLPPARILNVTPEQYHKLPGFSASLAKVRIARSLEHARDVHSRRLEKIAAEDETDDEDVKADKRKRLENGSIDHALILGIGKRVEPIPEHMLAKNGAISTKDAKEFCAGARAAGRIPVKEADLEIRRKVTDAVKTRIAAAGHVFDGRSELAVEWYETTPHGPIQCRGMMDHVVLIAADGLTASFPPDPPVTIDAVRAIIYDLKMVGDAHPERCMRTAEGLGYAIQAAAYTRALTALYPRLGGRVHFQFLFCENTRPYAMWDPERLSGAFRELGERRWLRSVREWAELQATGKAPSYREMGHDEITAPMWTLKQEGYPMEDM